MYTFRKINEFNVSHHPRAYFSHKFRSGQLGSSQINFELLNTISKGNSEGFLGYLDTYRDLIDFERTTTNGNRLIDWALMSANENQNYFYNHNGQYLINLVYLLLQGQSSREIATQRLTILERTKIKAFLEFIEEFPKILASAEHLDYSAFDVDKTLQLMLYSYQLIQLWHKPRIFEQIQLKKLIPDRNKELRVLSLGCGTIDEFIPLSKLYPNLRYMGIDTNKNSILI